MNDDAYLDVAPNIRIPLSEVEFTYAKSGGPGGQNVNKLNTKAVMRWALMSSTALPQEVHLRFIDKYKKQITVEGELVLNSQRHRSALENTEDCLEKLRAMIVAVSKAPRVRKATKPTAASKRRRLDNKKKQSQKKSGRKGVRGEE
jgi:ribosome-associated protein